MPKYMYVKKNQAGKRENQIRKFNDEEA